MSSTLLRPLALMFGYDLRTVRRSDSVDLHLQRYFKHHRTDLLIDVGAHVGGFGQMCRKIGYGGPILSFEPASAVFAMLEKAAHADGNWQAQRMGLGMAKARLGLNINAGANFNSLLPSKATMIDRFPALQTTAVEEVEIDRLDAVLDRLGVARDATIFLKSDTQGNDLDVLRGLGQRFGQVKALVLEMSVQPIYEGAPSHWEVGAFVHAAGFEAYGFSTVSRDSCGGMIEYDALFKRK